MQQADIAVIGAGIVGVAHALEAAKRGYRVVLFERNLEAQGASTRNFGAVIPLGMSADRMHDRAIRSREVWLDLSAKAGFWHNPTGALIVAYHEDEWAVLNEFAQEAGRQYRSKIIDAQEVLALNRAINPVGLLGGLHSTTELVIDPRQAMRKIPGYLMREYNVSLAFGTAVNAIELPYIRAGYRTWRVKQAIVCSGADFETLYPETFSKSGLTRCKLQMMRTEPQPNKWQLGPIVATGLSLKHFSAFADAQSLPALKERLATEYPKFERWGIHLLATQNSLDEVIIGDSHEYGLTPSPFDQTEIANLILAHWRDILHLPSWKIAERWHGIYAKHFEKEVVIETPAPDVKIVAGLGGAGMTTAFGLAQELFDEWQL